MLDIDKLDINSYIDAHIQENIETNIDMKSVTSALQVKQFYLYTVVNDMCNFITLRVIYRTGLQIVYMTVLQLSFLRKSE